MVSCNHVNFNISESVVDNVKEKLIVEGHIHEVEEVSLPWLDLQHEGIRNMFQLSLNASIV